MFVPDDKNSKIQGKHIKPVQSMNFKNSLFRYDHSYYDKDQRVGYIG
jgi:hypothetical protein